MNFSDHLLCAGDLGMHDPCISSFIQSPQANQKVVLSAHLQRNKQRHGNQLTEHSTASKQWSRDPDKLAPKPLLFLTAQNALFEHMLLACHHFLIVSYALPPMKLMRVLWPSLHAKCPPCIPVLLDASEFMIQLTSFLQLGKASRIDLMAVFHNGRLR